MAVPTLTANSPSAGFIAWGAFTIQYAGVAYPVSASNTNKTFTAWLYNAGTPLIVTSNSPPIDSIADGTSTDWAGTTPVLGPDDLLLFVNRAGVPINVQAAQMLDGDLIVTGTVTSNSIATNTITASNIAAGTITSAQIAANTITGSNIAGTTITGTNIATHTLTSDQIAAGSIVASSLAVGSVSDNRVQNAMFENLDNTGAAAPWTANWLSGSTATTGLSTTTVIDGSRSAFVTPTNTTTGDWTSQAFPVTPGHTMYAQAYFAMVTAFTNFTMQVEFGTTQTFANNGFIAGTPAAASNASVTDLSGVVQTGVSSATAAGICKIVSNWPGGTVGTIYTAQGQFTVPATAQWARISLVSSAAPPLPVLLATATTQASEAAIVSGSVTVTNGQTVIALASLFTPSSAGATTFAISDTLGGLTWTQKTANLGAVGNETIASIFYATATSNTTGTVTVTPSRTAAASTGMTLSVYEMSTGGAGVSGTSTASTTVTLSGTPVATSTVIGLLVSGLVSDPANTQPGGYVALFTDRKTGVDTYDTGSYKAGSATNTVTWGGTVTAAAAVAVEFLAPTGSVYIDDVEVDDVIVSAFIGNGQITANQISATAIDGKTITGAVIQTAAGMTDGGTIKGLRISGSVPDQIDFFTGDTNEQSRGVVYVQGGGGTPTGVGFIQINAPNFSTGSSSIYLSAGSHDGTVKPVAEIQTDDFYVGAVNIGTGGNVHIDGSVVAGRSINSTTDLQVGGVSIGRGDRVTTGMIATTTGSITTTEIVYGGISNLSFTTLASRRYLVMVRIPVLSTVAADIALIRVRDGAGSAPTNASTILFGEFKSLATVSQFVDGWFEWVPGAGSHNLGIFGQRNTGTGTLTLGSANSGFGANLIVMDIGL